MCLAVPGKVIEVSEDQATALRQGKVDFGGILKNVSLALTPEAGVGDYVLVHAGFAIGVVNEQEALQIFE
ncbi:MAG: HypC/HybG/HupF family hydrogenase formation chaperone, partial [Thermoleophilia bacterium]|nr:HypC/HybG/HupF family hydrogenase formation chaperone [Thermoleophilia bacterium]